MITDGQGKIDNSRELKQIIRQRVRVEFSDANYPGLGEGYGDAIDCPKGCGTGSHLQYVTFLADYDNRRESVSLHFQGECGHYWTVTYRQHKGRTYISNSPAFVGTLEGLSIGLREEHD